MFAEAGIRHAFETHDGGFVTMRVPVIEFDGIDVDQVPLTDALRVVEDGLNRPPVGDGVSIASVDTIVLTKLIAGRTQDLADIEAIIALGADREFLRATVQKAVPHGADTLGACSAMSIAIADGYLAAGFARFRCPDRRLDAFLALRIDACVRKICDTPLHEPQDR